VTFRQIIVQFQLNIGLEPLPDFDLCSFVPEGFPSRIHEETKKDQAASDCGVFDIHQLRASFQG